MSSLSESSLAAAQIHTICLLSSKPTRPPFKEGRDWDKQEAWSVDKQLPEINKLATELAGNTGYCNSNHYSLLVLVHCRVLLLPIRSSTIKLKIVTLWIETV